MKTVICYLILFFSLSGIFNPDQSIQKTNAKQIRTVVWIDADPSIGAAGKEVDDGFALIQAFNSPELEIRGVSIVFGNADFQTVWPIGQEIVRRFGPRGLQVYPGAATADESGKETEATRALAATLKKERLTILALGPITNVATVVKNHPELHSQIVEIIAVAGRRPSQKFIARKDQPRGFRDYNFELDAPGFQALIDSPVPLVLAPWEVSSKVWLKETDLQRLREGTEATKWLAAPATIWLKKWQDDLGLDGFNPFDTLAIGYLTDPKTIKWETLPIEIKNLPDDTQTTPKPGETLKNKPYLLVGPKIKSKKKVKYCFEPTTEFKETLMVRLLRAG